MLGMSMHENIHQLAFCQVKWTSSVYLLYGIFVLDVLLLLLRQDILARTFTGYKFQNRRPIHVLLTCATPHLRMLQR